MKFILIKQVLKSIAAVSLFASASVYGQTAPSEEQLRQAQQAGASQRADISQFVQTQGRSTGRSPQNTGMSSSGMMPIAESGLPPPYGANLFTSGYEAERSDGLNPAYLVAPGDKISIQLWGTVTHAEVLTVDNQGNIFIPDVGPVQVKDVPATRVNSVVTSKIKSIYTNNVNVYVNLLTATPVSVFVAGPVLRPGQYAGLASDSVLYYLKRAGGVDPERGSYRKISLLREGELLQTFDLYDFLREGSLAAISFKDGDVILVAEQGSVVTVEGAARYPFRFELEDSQSSGKDLTYYSRPLAKTSHVAVTGNRQTGPISVYFPIEEFSDFGIEDGDTVLFNDDLRPQVISVQISGSYLGPSFYTVNKDARLVELLDYIEVDPDHADVSSIFIKRKSVIEQQKLLIEESLQRLERNIFTAPATSDGEARIRAQEAQMVTQFIERARQVEPLGKVVVSANGNVANIRLEQGDEIVIPIRSDLVQIGGEVLLPQAVVYNPNAVVGDYIAWAGGFSERADDERIAIVHANGLTTLVDVDQGKGWLSDDAALAIKAGDQILVLPRVDTKILQAVKDVTQIMYQIAIAANVTTR
jgi:protein involved in polysaccharide export with SLBB domain